MELIAPCHFGMEAVLKREVLDLGYEISTVEDGRVCFWGDAQAICDANVFLRTAERILLKVGSFKAETFDELFEKTRVLPWENYIPKNGKFWVTKAASVKSKLFSPSDIQSIMKKAMVERLRRIYGIEWFQEDGPAYPIRVFLMKDIVTIGIDTSGVSLHKRGYRQMTVKAPITETLASALIMLTPWHKDRILVDPFCGSGTFPIEAAMMAANIAPGMNRSFTAESWMNIIPKKVWYDTIDEANDLIQDDVEVDSREMKHPVHVARLALIIQVLRYASDESHLQFVDTVSVKAAIRLNDYFEDSYVRIRSFMANDTCEEPPKVLLSLLPDTFDTKTAIAIGKELQGISERTVMNYLKELCHSRLLRKAKAGHYEKIVYESGKYSMNENE